VEEGEQPVLPGGGQECPELANRPDGSPLRGLSPWPLCALYRVAADDFIHDDGIPKCFPEHRMEMSHGRNGEWPAVTATAGEKVTVQLRDRGCSDGLNRDTADARSDVELDAGPVVVEGPGFDLHCVAVEPVIEVCGDRDGVAVNVFAAPGFDAGLVAGGLSFFLCGEAAHPSGLADAGLRSLTRIT
jgi:hypothetical protein